MIAPPICPCGRQPRDGRILYQLVYCGPNLPPERPERVFYDHDQFTCVWVKTCVEGRLRPLWMRQPYWTR